MAGEDPQPLGSLHPSIAPYGETFTTADRQQIVLAIGNNTQFAQLCFVLEAPALAADPAFSINVERVRNRKALFEKLQSLIATQQSEVLMQQFIKQGVPAGLIKSLKKVFEAPSAQALIRSESTGNGEKSISVKTVIFEIK